MHNINNHDVIIIANKNVTMFITSNKKPPVGGFNKGYRFIG